MGNTSDPSPSHSEANTPSNVTSASLSGKALLERYLALRDAFIDADTLRADLAARSLRSTADSLSHDTLFVGKDTGKMLEAIISETDGLLGEIGLEQRRRSFGMIGEGLLDFLSKAGYNAGKVYVQTCPMAFQDSEPASWLSDSPEILNPYLGKHHPKYAAGMLHCGEVTDSLGISR